MTLTIFASIRRTAVAALYSGSAVYLKKKKENAPSITTVEKLTVDSVKYSCQLVQPASSPNMRFLWHLFLRIKK